jgi:hypothetical protein
LRDSGTVLREPRGVTPRGYSPVRCDEVYALLPQTKEIQDYVRASGRLTRAGPNETSPCPELSSSFNWTLGQVCTCGRLMADGRELSEQTKSGLRLAFSVVAVLIILGILTKGLLLVRSGTRIGVVEGVAIISLIGVLGFVTTPRWAKWLFAVCCLMVLRCALASAFGRTVSVPSLEAPRIYFFEMAGLFALMAFLTYRFVDSRTTWLDSLCLVCAFVSIDYTFVSNSFSGLLLAVVFLGIGYAYQLYQERSRSQVTPEASSTTCSQAPSCHANDTFRLSSAIVESAAHRSEARRVTE